MSRRNFIVWWLASLLTATGIAIVAPLLVFIYPPEGNTKRQQLKVTLDKAINDLQEGEAVKFNAPANTAFVMIDGGGDNAPGDPAFSGYAVRESGSKVNFFAVNCSHLGCSIAINTSDKRFECPCHGSQFHLDGTVLHGPAVAPLSHLRVQQSGGTDITVEGISLPGLG